MGRREFMAGTAVAAGAMMWGKASGANDKVGLGIIGCGVRCNNHLDELLRKLSDLNVDIVALCDVWKVNLEKTAARVKDKTGKRPKTFARYAELLAQPDVDAVIITTPDFAHCPVLVDAAKAKKHAYVEKPMAARMEDANAALDAVLESGIVCQVGTQRRSEGPHIAAAKLIQSGVLGTMIKADCGWNDNGPRWTRPFDMVRKEDVDWEQYLMYLPKRDFDPRMYMCWHLYKDCSVGLVGLLGSHLIDVATWYTDDPIPASAVGLGANIVWKDRENTDTQECLFQFPKGHMLQCTCRLGNKYIGAENVFYGTNGMFDTKSWKVRGDGGGRDAVKEPIEVKPVESRTHMENWIDCIRAGNPKTNADIHAGYAHSVAAIMGSKTCDTGRRLVYDSATRTIKEG